MSRSGKTNRVVLSNDRPGELRMHGNDPQWGLIPSPVPDGYAPESVVMAGADHDHRVERLPDELLKARRRDPAGIGISRVGTDQRDNVAVYLSDRTGLQHSVHLAF